MLASRQTSDGLTARVLHRREQQSNFQEMDVYLYSLNPIHFIYSVIITSYHTLCCLIVLYFWALIISYIALT